MHDATVSPAVSDGQCVKYDITDTTTLTNDITDVAAPANTDGIFPIQNSEPLTAENGEVCGDSWSDDRDSSMMDNSENTTCDGNQSGSQLCLSPLLYCMPGSLNCVLAF